MPGEVEAIQFKPTAVLAPKIRITGHWWKVRLVPLMIFVLSVGLLGVAAYLDPDSRGHGTHEGLGLPACGFLMTTGIPCVSCGYTTSFALASDGRLWQSIVNQPGGALLALLTAMAALISAYTFVAGVSMMPVIQWMCRPRFVISLVGFMLVAWIYKIVVMTGVAW